MNNRRTSILAGVAALATAGVTLATAPAFAATRPADDPCDTCSPDQSATGSGSVTDTLIQLTGSSDPSTGVGGGGVITTDPAFPGLAAQAHVVRSLTAAAKSVTTSSTGAYTLFFVPSDFGLTSFATGGSATFSLAATEHGKPVTITVSFAMPAFVPVPLTTTDTAPKPTTTNGLATLSQTTVKTTKTKVAAPVKTLAFTGAADVIPMLGIGVLLIGTGTGAIVISRRGRRTSRA
jgi:hypothetical protein